MKYNKRIIASGVLVGILVLATFSIIGIASAIDEGNIAEMSTLSKISNDKMEGRVIDCDFKMKSGSIAEVYCRRDGKPNIHTEVLIAPSEYSNENITYPEVCVPIDMLY